MKDCPFVSIIIPTYNRKEEVKRLVESLTESNYPENKLEIIVVDDASSDGTYNVLKSLFPNIIIVRNDEEKLLSESRNTGIRLSRGEYIFLIDDDNIVDCNAIKNMVCFLEKNPEVGIVGPIIYFLRDPKRIWCAGAKISYWTTITKIIGYNTFDNCQFIKPFESECFPNSFMIRKEIIQKVGLFDSRLFLIHYDESDFCQRVRKEGYKIMTVPLAKVWHDIQLPKEGEHERFHLKSPLRAYYSIRNRLIFHRKWSSNVLQKISAITFSMGVLLYYIYIVLSAYTLKGSTKWQILKKLMKGFVDGFARIFP